MADAAYMRWWRKTPGGLAYAKKRKRSPGELEGARAWKARNPEHLRNYEMTKHHGPHWKAIFERDGYRCVQCGSDQNLHLDHIVPRKMGGTHDMENQQTLCKPCHSSKDAKLRWALRRAAGIQGIGTAYP